MDYTQIAIAVLGVVCTIIGWFASQLWQAVHELKKDVTDVRVEYVRYDRLQDAMKPIIDSLQEIKQTLGQKADK